MKSWMSRSADKVLKSTVLKVAFAAVLAASLSGCVSAVPEQRTVVSSLTVDVSPLRQRGYGYADRVADSVLRNAATQFQVSPGSGAPGAVLVVDTVQLGTRFAGNVRVSKWGAATEVEEPARDYMGGTVNLVSGGRIVASSKVLTNLTADENQMMILENEQRRVENLSASFAQWARRRLPQ